MKKISIASLIILTFLTSIMVVNAMIGNISLKYSENTTTAANYLGNPTPYIYVNNSRPSQNGSLGASVLQKSSFYQYVLKQRITTTLTGKSEVGLMYASWGSGTYKATFVANTGNVDFFYDFFSVS